MIESYQRLRLLGNRYQELFEEVAGSKSTEQRAQLLHQMLLLVDDMDELILKTLKDERVSGKLPDEVSLDSPPEI
jgi:hypothetical protein